MLRPLPDEVAAYSKETHRRLHVRPGLTGLWQVSGRSNTTYDERVALDVDYVVNWSNLQDVKIIMLTVPAIVFSKGAR